MIISRGSIAIRCVLSQINNRAAKQGVQPARHSSGVWSYRQPAPPQEKVLRIMAECVGGLMWWWIMWHFWHESGHVFGEFDYPDPSKWTDEELGIPPDDEE